MADDRPQPMPEWLGWALAAGIVLWLVTQTVPAEWAERPFGLTKIRHPEGEASCLRDMPSHVRFTRLLWRGGWRTDHSVYSPQTHRELLDGLPAPAAGALPFGYSPTMAWLLGPFALLSDQAAYLAWTVLSLAVVLWLTGPRAPLPWVGCLFFFSPVASWSFYHAQTAVFSVAAMVLLWRWSAGPGRWSWLAVLLLWALSAKPPLAVTAAAALLVAGRWRVVVAALALCGLTTAALHPWLGDGWARDYLRLLGAYNLDEADPLFAWSLYPDYMANLRAGLFAGGASDAVASRISSVCWLLSLGGLAAFGWAGRLRREAAWPLAVLALLLFSPHLNITEELHLYVAAVASTALRRAVLPWAFVAGFWLTAPLYFGPAWAWPWVALVGKFILVGLTLWAARTAGESSARRLA